MLSDFVRTGAGRRRHLSTPIGRYLDGYLAWRFDRGFAKATVASNLQWATAFGEYLAEVDLREIAKIDDSVVEEFIDYYERPAPQIAFTTDVSPKSSIPSWLTPNRTSSPIRISSPASCVRSGIQ